MTFSYVDEGKGKAQEDDEAGATSLRTVLRCVCSVGMRLVSVWWRAEAPVSVVACCNHSNHEHASVCVLVVKFKLQSGMEESITTYIVATGASIGIDIDLFRADGSVSRSGCSVPATGCSGEDGGCGTDDNDHDIGITAGGRKVAQLRRLRWIFRDSNDGAQDPEFPRQQIVVGHASCKAGPTAATCTACTTSRWLPGSFPASCGSAPGPKYQWPSTSIAWGPPLVFSMSLHLRFIFFYAFLFYFVLVQFRTRTVIVLHTHGEIEFLWLLLSDCVVQALQPLVLKFSAPVRRLLLRRWIDYSAFTWVFGFSGVASSTSDNVINIILRLSECFSFDGSFDPLSTVALRGQSIWVHASLTPLRIPLAGSYVYFLVLVDDVVFFSGRRTLMYPGLPRKTSL